MAHLGNTSRLYYRIQPDKFYQFVLKNKTNNNLNNIINIKFNNKKNISTYYFAQNNLTYLKKLNGIYGENNNQNNINNNSNNNNNGLTSKSKILINSADKINGFSSSRQFSIKTKTLGAPHNLNTRILSGTEQNTKNTQKNENNTNNINTNCTNNNLIRGYSSVHTQQPAGPVREIQVDPYSLTDDDLKSFYEDIRKYLHEATTQRELGTISSYYFDGQGKALRPMVAMLMSRAINYHMNKESSHLLHRQRTLAIVSEMVHSASLVHDDVIDQSDFRRGKPSVNVLWNHKKVTMAGDYILSVACILMSRLNNDEVSIALGQICTDLVQGEFMQLGAKENENERFTHYLSKTYRKTASLIANSLKCVALLAEANDELIETAFQYGRNIGLAFQLVDDMLDFVSSSDAMGKPTAADLKLGLATAPVLFACEKYPELNPMIMRRFQEPGDAERAFELVHKSQGLEQTRFLARKHCIEAIRLAQQIADSPYQKGLVVVSDLVLNRMK